MRKIEVIVIRTEGNERMTFKSLRLFYAMLDGTVLDSPLSIKISRNTAMRLLPGVGKGWLCVAVRVVLDFETHVKDQNIFLIRYKPP